MVGRGKDRGKEEGEDVRRLGWEKEGGREDEDIAIQKDVIKLGHFLVLCRLT